MNAKTLPYSRTIIETSNARVVKRICIRVVVRSDRPRVNIAHSFGEVSEYRLYAAARRPLPLDSEPNPHAARALKLAYLEILMFRSVADVMTNSAKHDLVGSTIGPYNLREVIGEGGMGTVYVAEQETPIRRKVALKVITSISPMSRSETIGP